MGPKVTKKAADKAKVKTIEDKTFGLKNKNRSAKVQAFVAQTVKTVQQGNPAQMKKQKEYDDKKKAKEAKQAFEAEMSSLFKTVDDKKPEKAEDGDKNAGVDPEDYLWTAEDFDAVEEDNSRLEEKLELEREALKGRTDLTPVTEATFQAWKERKRIEKAKAEKERVDRAKKGKGAMRGKDLWDHDKDLFVDDEDADAFDDFEREDMLMDDDQKAMMVGMRVFEDTGRRSSDDDEDEDDDEIVLDE